MEAPSIRKSKRLATGKAKVIQPKQPKKKKSLPQLDDVPRKKRKLLDASTALAITTNVSFCFLFFHL